MIDVVVAGERFPKQPVLDCVDRRRSGISLPSLLDLPNILLTQSGRSALGLALKLLGLRSGQHVLVPAYHCPTMIAPVEMLGGVPTFYPIDSKGAPDLNRTRVLPGTHSMLVAHLFGLPLNLGTVAEFCRSHGLALVEDCAHCFTGIAGAVPVGTTGDYAIGSLPKFFPVIEGGILASSRHAIGNELSLPRPWAREVRAIWDVLDVGARAGRLGSLGSVVRTVSALRGRHAHDSLEEETEPSRESIRLLSMRDRMLDPVGLRRVEASIVRRTDLVSSGQRRRDNFRCMAQEFGTSAGCAPLVTDCGDLSAPYVVPLLLAGDVDATYRRMRTAGLPVFRWDRLWPGTPSPAGEVATTWSRALVQVACHQSLDLDDALAVARLARNCMLANPGSKQTA